MKPFCINYGHRFSKSLNQLIEIIHLGKDYLRNIKFITLVLHPKMIGMAKSKSALRKQVIDRSTTTGRFVSAKFAKTHPKTTAKGTLKISKEK